MRQEGSAADSIWVVMEFLKSLKRERKAEVEDESGESGLRVSKRVWRRAASRSIIDWCFFCKVSGGICRCGVSSPSIFDINDGNDNKRAPEAADGGLKSAAARGW